MLLPGIRGLLPLCLLAVLPAHVAPLRPSCHGSPTCQLMPSHPTMEASMEAIKRMAAAINHTVDNQKRSGAPPCHLVKAGSGWGEHALCEHSLHDHPCVFYSFGISVDYTFDRFLSQNYSCRGVAFDPSIAHNSTLVPGVLFFQVGARSLNQQDDNHWDLVTSVPGVRSWLKHPHINVLKMDCEGCEYALARDVLAEDPAFFHHVSQFAVEIHIGSAWARSPNHIIYLGALFQLLQEAKLELVHVALTPCAPFQEHEGCPKELLEANYPCGSGIMCQNLLFAKLPHMH